MTISSADVLAELKILRKGFGMDDPGAPTRIGEALRYVAGVPTDAEPAVQRSALRRHLLDVTVTMPQGLSRLARLALALDDAPTERFGRRLARAAAELDRDERTARRHVDAALARLAEEALAAVAGRPSAADPPWYTESLHVLLLLDRSMPQVVEERQVVSGHDGLTHIALSHSFPTADVSTPVRDGSGLSFSVVHGGTPQHSMEPQSRTRVGSLVRLPRPLRRGERHRLTIRVAGPLAPFYVCTPLYPCQHFALTVWFGTAPAQLRVVDDELPLEAGDPNVGRIRLKRNASGAVQASFTGLRPNRSYGLSWAEGPGRAGGSKTWAISRRAVAAG
ncbi:hypothetical protein ACMA1D_00950 [Streptomyces sp. 796.1]|uniref:hypothetical protein n=1 Tax=Streptomyces sp. 796.1 TaxID=3163029 RepID=UPI0039C95797